MPLIKLSLFFRVQQNIIIDACKKKKIRTIKNTIKIQNLDQNACIKLLFASHRGYVFVCDADCWCSLFCVYPTASEQLQMFVLSLFLMRGWHGFAYIAKQASA